jgi:hypothetical protein
MACWQVIACVIGVGEAVASVYFFCLNQQLSSPEVLNDQIAEVEDEGISDKNRFQPGSAIKGILERMTILIGLLAEYSTILPAFAALKLGTRLADDSKTRISNTYFLTGNLSSILLAIVYAWIIRGHCSL